MRKGLITNLKSPVNIQVNPEPVSKEVLDHRVTVRQMLKVIQDCPMDDKIKMVMRMRIWGIDSEVFKPLSMEEIAKICRKIPGPATAKELEYLFNLEAEGKHKCWQHLFCHSMEDICSRIDRAQAEKLFGIEGKLI